MFTKMLFQAILRCYFCLLNKQLGWDMWLKAAMSRQTKIRLGDMIPGSTYVFRIKAENPFGVSDPSPSSEPIRLPVRRFFYFFVSLLKTLFQFK